MNKKKLKKLLPIIQLITKLPQEQRAGLLEYLSDEAHEGLCECIYNGIANKSLLGQKKSQFLKEKVRKDQKALLTILRPNISKKTRRRKMIQSGGSIALILATVLPMLAEYVVKKIF